MATPYTYLTDCENCVKKIYCDYFGSMIPACPYWDEEKEKEDKETK